MDIIDRLNTMLEEHEALPGVLFTSPDAEPRNVIVRAFKDDPGVRITIEDSTRDVNLQLLVSEQRMIQRLNDPSPM